MPALTFTATDDHVTLTAPPAAQGLFARLTGKASSASVDAMSREDWTLGLALSDLRALAEVFSEEDEDAQHSQWLALAVSQTRLP